MRKEKELGMTLIELAIAITVIVLVVLGVLFLSGTITGGAKADTAYKMFLAVESALRQYHANNRFTYPAVGSLTPVSQIGRLTPYLGDIAGELGRYVSYSCPAGNASRITIQLNLSEYGSSVAARVADKIGSSPEWNSSISGSVVIATSVTPVTCR